MQWFVKEQVEEIATMSDLLTVVTPSRRTTSRPPRTTWLASGAGGAADATAPRMAGA